MLEEDYFTIPLIFSMIYNTRLCHKSYPSKLATTDSFR